MPGMRVPKGSDTLNVEGEALVIAARIDTVDKAQVPDVCAIAVVMPDWVAVSISHAVSVSPKPGLVATVAALPPTVGEVGLLPVQAKHTASLAAMVEKLLDVGVAELPLAKSATPSAHEGAPLNCMVLLDQKFRESVVPLPTVTTFEALVPIEPAHHHTLNPLLLPLTPSAAVISVYVLPIVSVTAVIVDGTL